MSLLLSQYVRTLSSALWYDETSDLIDGFMPPISLMRHAYLNQEYDLEVLLSYAEDNSVFDVEVYIVNNHSNVKLLACPLLTDDCTC
jgi:hypothetical protein